MSLKTSNMIISALVFVCFVLYTIIELRPVRPGQLDESLNKVKQLQQENDSLKKSNADLDEEFAILQNKADRLQLIVLKTNDDIIKLKNKQHEKINAIDKLTNDELLDFFSGYKTESTSNR
jgi:hypothetical protein